MIPSRAALFLLLLPTLLSAQPDRSIDTAGAFLPPTYDSAALAAALIYPAEALEANIEGEVVAELLIATDGRIIDLGRIATHPLLNNAVDSVFSSFAVMRVASLNNDPSGSWSRLRFRFTRDDNGVGIMVITDTSAPRDQVDQMIEDDVIVVNTARLPSYDHAHLHSAAIYPQGSSSLGSMSTVEVMVLVSLDNRGHVVGTKVLEGNERFREAARRAVQATVFTPAILNGDLIPLQIIVPVTFTPPVRVDPHGDGSSHDAAPQEIAAPDASTIMALARPQKHPVPVDDVVADEISLFDDGALPDSSNGAGRSLSERERKLSPEQEMREEPLSFLPYAMLPAYDKTALQKHLTYPPEAVTGGMEGRVLVRVKIDEKGRLIDAQIVHGIGNPLDSVALDAVRKISYSPGMNGKDPVKMSFMIPITFILPGTPEPARE